MKKNKQNRLFSFVSDIFYREISPKFRADSFKNFMDFAYVIFEKIAVNFECLYQNYLYLYEEIVEKEIKSSNISKNDSVLIIGCGSIPSTSILVSKLSNPKEIISIDFDKNAIKNSINLMHRKSFDKSLKFENADGLNYSVEKFDVIFILYGIKKQRQILEILSSKIKDTSRILFRTTNDALDQYIGGKTVLESMFKVKDSIASINFAGTTSFILMKK